MMYSLQNKQKPKNIRDIQMHKGIELLHLKLKAYKGAINVSIARHSQVSHNAGSQLQFHSPYNIPHHPVQLGGPVIILTASVGPDTFWWWQQLVIRRTFWKS
ncbi:hypothetical protein RRG08_012339 [Elysia crispata]|nr:hypothetical protein RRG08_012339 [Elysia crispata]